MRRAPLSGGGSSGAWLEANVSGLAIPLFRSCASVCVENRGGQVSVSRELLSDTRIDARSEEGRCEVVAQVSCDPFEVRSVFLTSGS